MLHPLAVGLMMWLLPPDDLVMSAVGVMFAGMPMLSIYPILAQKYGHEDMCAAALLLATGLSFSSVSVIL